MPRIDSINIASSEELEKELDSLLARYGLLRVLKALQKMFFKTSDIHDLLCKVERDILKASDIVCVECGRPDCVYSGGNKGCLAHND